MTINIEELREAEALLGKMARHAAEVLPLLELLEKLGGRAIIPTPADRLIQRGEVMELLKIGTLTVNQLIREGKLTPLYVANSSTQKFWLSEVKQLVSTEPEKAKPCNLKRKVG